VSDEKITHKDYTDHSARTLNKLIGLRNRQITKALAGNNPTTKSIAQLRYEQEAMTNVLMERAMTGGK